jgi:hypothetical protein
MWGVVMTHLAHVVIRVRTLIAAGPLAVLVAFGMLATACTAGTGTGTGTGTDIGTSPPPATAERARPTTRTSPATQAKVTPEITDSVRRTAGSEFPACAQTRTWGTGTKQSAPYTTAELYNVRAGRHACYDRVVFDVNGADPVGYSVSYVRKVLADGSGQPVPVAGGAALEVIVHAPDFFAAPGGHQPWREPWRVGQALAGPTRWPALKEVRFAGSFEGQTTFAAGVRARLPFRVFTLNSDGTRRVIIDIAHRS